MTDQTDYIEFIKEQLPLLACDDIVKIGALDRIQDWFNSIDISKLSATFANFYINDAFESIYALVQTETYVKVKFFITENLLREIPSLKHEFLPQFHEMIGNYARKDQISILNSFDLIDCDILQPFLSPKSSSEFIEIKSFLNTSNTFGITFKCFIKNTVLQFIETNVKITDETRPLLKHFNPTSPQDLRILQLFGDEASERINNFLSDDIIEEYHNGLGFFKIKRESALFSLFYSRLLKAIEMYKNGVVTNVLVFLLRCIVDSLVAFPSLDQLHLCDEMLQIINIAVGLDLVEQNASALKYALKGIGVYLFVNTEEVFDIVIMLWDLLVSSIATSYKDIIVLFLTELLRTDNDELLQLTLVALNDKLSVDYANIYDSANGINLAIVLTEKVYDLQKNSQNYANVTNLRGMECLSVIQQIIKELNSQTAKHNAELFLLKLLY
ncbi:Uncharacterized protein QTN25_005577 [Entamoeba marina]